MSSSPNNSRRNALRQLTQGLGALTVGGYLWGSSVGHTLAHPLALRPPGALPEADFIKSCIKCGSCATACPYNTLHLAGTAQQHLNGTPYFEPRTTPCYLCPDIPCAQACPSGALDLKLLLPEINETTTETINATKPDVMLSRMGLAVIDTQTCVAHWGIQCDACYRACPLINKAIILRYAQNERTGKHAYITPEIQADACTGCGICEQVCITEQPAVRILPLSLLNGKSGAHYVRSWIENDEKRLQDAPVQELKPDEKKTIDYLNNTDDLFD